MEKLTTELHSLSEMDRRHVVSILAKIANGYDDFNDMLIYLGKVRISRSFLPKLTR
ncbi:hypothetical protein [Escherichia coli]|uniref:hypothetical protein n=1 Tax=Escherichia coli TaxID=562 RepID=UPI0021BA5DBA|nr:hypothetical protein [Escherichia coli]